MIIQDVRPLKVSDVENPCTTVGYSDMISIMLANDETIELIRTQPDVTYFFYDQPILYSVFYKGNHYMISLVEDHVRSMTERFLIVQYSEMTKGLLEQKLLTPREFFTYPENHYTDVLVCYSADNPPVVAHFKTYDSPSDISDRDLPMEEARWDSQVTSNPYADSQPLRRRLEALFISYGFKSRKFSHTKEPSTRTADALWLTWHRKNTEQDFKIADSIEIRVTFTSNDIFFVVHSYGKNNKGCLPYSQKQKFSLPEQSVAEILPYIRALQTSPVSDTQ